MITERNLSRWIANIFFWGTILGLPLLLLRQVLGKILLLFGANSLSLFFVYRAGEESGVILWISGIWFCCCVLLLIPAYFLAIRKNRYFLLGMVMVLDAMFVCACAAYEFLQEHTYGVTSLLPDIFVSLAMCCVLLYILPCKKQTAEDSQKC